MLLLHLHQRLCLLCDANVRYLKVRFQKNEKARYETLPVWYETSHLESFTKTSYSLPQSIRLCSSPCELSIIIISPSKLYVYDSSQSPSHAASILLSGEPILKMS